MNSIRRRLTIWLLCGLAVLWVAAGAGVYFSIQQSLLKSIDAELAVDSRILRFATRSDDVDDSRSGGGARKLQGRMPAYDESNGDAFFQVWDADGKTEGKSVSLGELDLDFPGAEIATDPAFVNLTLSDGREIRTMRFRTNASGGKGKGKSAKGRRSGAVIAVLGKDTASVRETLRSVLGGITFVGIVVGIGAVLLVRFAVNRGLKPLHELGKQTELINAESLDARFNANDAPSELQPIYVHLNDLIHRLESSFDRERRFSSDLAHEMRTPVAELKMMNEVALKWKDQAGEKTHAESLEIAEQLEATIETLLTLARCEAGELESKSETIDLADFVKKCWEPYSKKVGEKELTVKFDFPDNNIEFDSDPRLMRHIVNNLLSNAVEYSPENDVIVVNGAGDDLAVSNAAPDFNPANLEKMFDRYWRADESRTGSGHAGLGLSLAKTCADFCDLDLRASFENGRIQMRLGQR